MITTITINPCIDRTISIKNFKFGNTNKVISSRQDISGKGINVSVILKNYGINSIVLGFNFIEGGDYLQKFLDDKRIIHDLVNIDDYLRTNTKIFDIETKIMTEYNEQGAFVAKRYKEEFFEKLDRNLDKTKILIISGSAPKGIDKYFYKNIIELANRKKIKVLLDSSGDLLNEGIKARPFLIKPNLEEFKSISNSKMKTLEDFVIGCKEIVNSGVNVVCLSLGSKGALLVSKDEAYYANPVDVKIKGIQGAGDSLVAGMAMAIKKELNNEEILKYGVTLATSSLLYEGTQLGEIDDFNDIYHRVLIKKIKVN